MKTLIRLAGMLLLMASPPLAEGAVPKPKLRPAQAAAPQRPAAEIPIPKLRPSPALPEGPAPSEKPSEPQVDKENAEGETAGWSAASVAAEQRRCTDLLKGLDVDYKPLDPIGNEGGCGAPAPVLVSRVAGVALEPAATLTCPMAEALHRWITASVKPAAQRRLKTDVAAIHTATSYACRRRNNSSSGKMSEHSHANALDMSGFSFAAGGKSVAVEGGGWGEGILSSFGLSKPGSFLGDIRKDSCAYFTTVLGPGSDAAHGDHFHVDVLQRKGGYRICQ